MDVSSRKLLLFLICFCLNAAAASGPFTLNEFLGLKRLGDAQVSPDGKWIAYAVREPNLSANKFASHIWVQAADGAGKARQLTNHEKGESRPQWSPDSKSIAFLSTRGGSQQIWTIPIDGGEARQATTISTETDNHIWSPDGSLIAFTSDVWPDLASDEGQKKRADEREASGVKAQVIDSLLYRHWMDWRHGKRSHIFIVSADGGTPRDLTPGDFEAPVFSLGGAHLFAFSPDSKFLAFTRGPARTNEAWTTDTSLMLAPISGGGELRNLTADNKGWDGSPAFSPDGKYIAYLSQSREGFEADKFRVTLLDRATGSKTDLTKDLDGSASELLWSSDSRHVFFVAEKEARSALYRMPIAAGAKLVLVAHGPSFGSLSAPKAGGFVIATTHSLLRAPELGRLDFTKASDGFRRITSINNDAFATHALPTVESIRHAGARDKQVQAWLLRPPGFDASKKYRGLLLIHGGPQGAWEDAWSFRWNAMLYASQGYVVLAPNPHGSTGFGQDFTDEISGDWGGAVYEDVMKSAAYLSSLSYVDANRLAAAGGSFGGYMVNWIMGAAHPFKTFVSHAGVYNLESMYGVTEELWFADWEFKGSPWKNPELFQKWSPHRRAGNFKTPTLITHGELDFRVPIGEGLQLFTALQRQGIESRLLYFPDEGHWINKLKNAELFYKTVFEWLDEQLK